MPHVFRLWEYQEGIQTDTEKTCQLDTVKPQVEYEPRSFLWCDTTAPSNVLNAKIAFREAIKRSLGLETLWSKDIPSQNVLDIIFQPYRQKFPF